ncbi:MAG: type II toxin-antitoxin system HigB family toxin [Nitrosomonas sp.]|nr:type II toxin-antitoxin system HigB family toxin [Nitrosomonas sp.]UJP00316.1 MAG: type II toxin-antitoxin system HigB family toxin [Nitrosomonas sp.]
MVPRHALKANWTTPAEVKADFKSASILKDGSVVFNLPAINIG